MLSLNEVSKALEHVTYKDGWSFEVYEDRWEGHKMLIKAVVPNGYASSETITLGIHTYLPPMKDFHDLHHWLMWRIGRIEIHEMREFYRVNGVLFDDPHAEKDQ